MHIKSVNLFLDLYILICIHYKYSDATAIIGENVVRVTQDEFPFVVSLIRLHSDFNEPEKNHICTGALISSKNVVTAEHCLESERQIGIAILIGSVNLRYATRYYIFWWKTFFDWVEVRNDPLQFIVNDVAVIRLISEVPDTVFPGVLTSLSNDIFHGLNADIVGWGVTNNGKNPKIMRKACIYVITNEACEEIVERLHGIKLAVDTRFMCSQASPNALLGKGDSGGPIIHMGKIIGINRSTMPLPELVFHPEKVNIHIGIRFYRDFLVDIIENY